MTRAIFSILFGLFLLFAVRSVFSDEPPIADETLRRISSAQREVSYVGKRLITISTPNRQIVREEFVVHHPPNIYFVKPLSSLGERGEQARGSNDEERRRRKRRGGESESRPRMGGRRPPSGWRPPMVRLTPKEIGFLQQNYTLTLDTAEPIVGYETQKLTIAPRYPDRPTKHLFIARDNGVILRVEDLDPNGVLRFLSVYTQISFKTEDIEQKIVELKLPEQPENPRRPRSQEISILEAQQQLDNRLIQPTYLPPGFHLQRVATIQNHAETVYLRYTDGLVTFSLFESKKQSRRGIGGNPEVEQLHGIKVQVGRRDQIHLIRFFVNEIEVTLIGGLNRAELLKVAESAILNAKK
jgi:negative regulator of sigma E activity